MNLYILTVALLAIKCWESFGCGVAKISSTVSVEGGTYPGQWPWHAAIYRKGANRTLNYTCGGTLITAKMILTAGVCVLDDSGNRLPKEDFLIRLGVYNLNGPNLNTGQHRWVKQIHQPSDKRSKQKYVITLLELLTKALFNSYVQPACVFNLEGIDNRYSEIVPSGTIVGWGQTWDDHIAVLKSHVVNIPLLLDCFKHDSVYRPTEQNSLFCVGSAVNGTQVCREDSGSGLYVEMRGVWHVAGVVSYTPQQLVTTGKCRTESYAGLTNVYDSITWLSGKTNLTHLLEKISVKGGKEADQALRYRNLLPRHCGSFIVNRIIKGNNAPLFTYPWMALLGRRDPYVDKILFTCAGTLINNRYVLTASRCVDHALMPEFVRLGEHTVDQNPDCIDAIDETDCAPPFRDYDVQFIVKNTNLTNTCLRNNVALIRLKTAVIFEEHIQPVCLPVTTELRRTQLDQYTITGWGATNYEQFHLKSLILQHATIPASRLAECDQHYVNYRNEIIPGLDLKYWAPNGSFVATCLGDDGGPLGYPVRHNGVRFVQFGVIVFGLPGCTGGPSVYLNVSRFMDWILANLEK